MSTIVSSTDIGTVATGLPPSDWKDVTNLIGGNNQSDNLYAYYEFDGTPDAGQEYDEALYLRSWHFNLPDFSVVEDIQVNIERKATGTGTVTDADIRLYFPTAPAPAYDSANLTINQASGSAWPSTDAIATYSGTWNKSWTDEEINNAMFGVFIRAAESVTTNNTALIDQVSVTVTYHLEIILDGTGGGVCGGSATVEFIDAIEGSGGVEVGGQAFAPNTFSEIGSGGIVAEGSAAISEAISASGGVVAGGQVLFVSEINTSGGVVVNGGALEDFNDQVDGSGGIQAGGEAQVESGIFGTSGVETGGAGIDTKVVGSVIASGGAEVSGEAIVNPYIAEGGANVGGSAEHTMVYADPAEHGGIEVGGLSLVITTENVGGGVIVTANPITPQRVITIPDWEFTLDGDQVFPTSNDTTATAFAEFWYDPIERNLSWRITYSGFAGPIDVARLRRGDPGETGPQLIDLFSDPISKIESTDPFTGMAKGVSDDLHDELTAAGGKSSLYIMFGSTTDNDKIRSNFVHYGMSVAAVEASVEPYYEIPSGGATLGGIAEVSPIIAEGGAVVGGQADSPWIDYIDGTGGVIIGGVTGVSTEIIDGTGGVVLGGDAIEQQVEGSITTSGGVIVGRSAAATVGISSPTSGGTVIGGSAVIEFVYNIDPSEGVVINGESIPDLTYLVTPEGGVIVNGTSPPGITISVGGGIVVGGEIDFAYISNPVITGGVELGGQHIQTFIDYFIATGGVRISGKGNGNKIKFFQEFKTGICRALKSDNICKEDPFQQELLPPPGAEDVGELDPDRFRIEYLPTWCDVDDKLQPYEKVVQECDAAVSEVINQRQKGIMPPKTGRAQVRDRGIATLDAL